MLKARAICMTIAGVFMLSAIASASAVAAEAGWMVEGKNLAAGERENVSEETMKVSATYKVVSGGVIIECTTLKVKSGSIIGTNKASGKSLVLSGCISGSTNCTLSSGTLASVPLLVEATLDPPNALAAVAEFRPATGTSFLTFKFEGEKCSLVGTKPISGRQAVLLPSGADENKEQVAEAIELTAGELKLGPANATLTGSVGFTLESGKSWSFL